MTNQSAAAPVQTISPAILRAHPLRQFTDDASKADYGKLLIVGGSARLLGAALLCARAALRAGCGTVRLAAPQSVASVLGAACPELMVIPLPETKRGTVAKGAAQLLVKQWPPCDAAVIGPGLDEDDETLEISRSFVKWCPLPTVVDASAIAAASTCDFAGLRIVTPHAGEMKALLDDFKPSDHDYDPNDAEETALKWANERGAVLVLKGRATIIAEPGGKAWHNTAGTRGLGTAGSGDVLAGVIGALLAQGNAPELAAMHGVHLHALAGEDAARERGDDGLMASDFLERLPFVRRELEREVRRR